MMRIFAAPARYVQGRDALTHLGTELQSLGIEGTALVVMSKSAEKALGQKWGDSLRSAHIKWEVERFQGECTDKEIDRLAEVAQRKRVDFVIAMGGGKVIDATRAMADKINKEVVVCPTVASTDAPCLSISVIYTEKGEMQELRMFRRNPVLVLVDSEVIAKSPKRLFVAGIGDAISTYYESRVCKENYAENPRGGIATEAGMALSKLCRDILFRDGAQALRALEQQTTSPAFERVVEANTLLSGLGAELCGVAAAHAIHDGLTAAPQTHSYYHGEKVAFGLLAQLIMEGRSSREINELLEFYREVGLPMTFEQIGISRATPELLTRIAERATRRDESIHNEPFQISPEIVIDALKTADHMGRRYLEERPAISDTWFRAA